MTAPDFLSIEDVLELHSMQLEQYGGAPGIRDRGLLSSAVMTVPATFDGNFVYSDIFSMAAAYAFHIAENQPFIDGNKRTALASALVFLEINGYEVIDPTGCLYQAMMDIAAKKLSKLRLSEILKSLTLGSREE
jgi:death-on-curing protein